MHDKNAVFEFIKDMIVEMKDSEPDDIRMQTAIDELGLDSLDYVEIQVGVKRKFGVALSPTLFERQIKTLDALCGYIADADPALEKTA
jgi:acyl carrier protein